MTRLPLVAVLALLLGCSAAESAGSAASDGASATASVPATAAAAAAAAGATVDAASDVAADAGGALPLVTVRKHPTCGCCSVWIDHLRDAGFPVEAHDVEDMAAVKDAAGVPQAMGSCHTAEVAGYFIEGHVPASDIARLLRERPSARGLAVPGMPVGSPGMEHPQGIVHPYQVLLVEEDGNTREFSRYPEASE